MEDIVRVLCLKAITALHSTMPSYGLCWVFNFNTKPQLWVFRFSSVELTTLVVLKGEKSWGIPLLQLLWCSFSFAHWTS